MELLDSSGLKSLWKRIVALVEQEASPELGLVTLHGGDEWTGTDGALRLKNADYYINKGYKPRFVRWTSRHRCKTFEIDGWRERVLNGYKHGWTREDMVLPNLERDAKGNWYVKMALSELVNPWKIGEFVYCMRHGAKQIRVNGNDPVANMKKLHYGVAFYNYTALGDEDKVDGTAIEQINADAANGKRIMMSNVAEFDIVASVGENGFTLKLGAPGKKRQ